MIRNEVLQKIEPEQRKLREDPSFIRNRCGHDDIECGKTVGGDNEQFVAEIVDVAHFAASRGRNAGEICFLQDAHGSRG